MPEKQRNDELANALRRMSEQSASEPGADSDISSGALHFDAVPLDENIPLINFDVGPQIPDEPPPLDPTSLPDEPLTLEAPGRPRGVPPNLPPLKPSAAPPPVKATPSLSDSAAFVPPKPVAPATPAKKHKSQKRRDRPHAPVQSSAPSPSVESQQPFTFRLPAPRPMNSAEDDDSVIVPAPSPDSILPQSSFQDAARERALRRSLFLRRTMIPILLTCGLLLVGLAAGWFATDPDSVYRTSGRWLPFTLLITGGILLFLAVLNMAQVRHLLLTTRTPPVR